MSFKIDLKVERGKTRLTREKRGVSTAGFEGQCGSEVFDL